MSEGFPSVLGDVRAADLYGDIQIGRRSKWRDALPGLVVVALGTMAAGFMSDHYHAPLTLMALLVGLSLNFLSADARLTPGVTFASRTMLRWGVVLLGLRVTAGDVIALGPWVLLSVAALVAMTMSIGSIAARKFGLGIPYGVLAGGAVAICGASAAMALAALLGDRRVPREQLTLVLVVVSAFSASAMMLYPVVARALSLTDAQAGFLFGASIHDVAQALGAGYAYSAGAGRVATIVKLARVALLAPALAVISILLPREDGTSPKVDLPWFVLGFFALVALNSLGVLPRAAGDLCGPAASAILAAALTATAIRSPLSGLLHAGLRPVGVIAAATAFAFAAALLLSVTVVR